MTCQTEAETKLIDVSRWDPPVENRDELSRRSAQGQLCFVKADDCTYVRGPDGWAPVQRPR